MFFSSQSVSSVPIGSHPGILWMQVHSRLFADNKVSMNEKEGQDVKEEKNELDL